MNAIDICKKNMKSGYFLLLLFISAVNALPLVKNISENGKAALADLTAETIKYLMKTMEGQAPSLEDNSVVDFVDAFLETAPSVRMEGGKLFNHSSATVIEINTAANVTKYLFSADIRLPTDQMRQVRFDVNGVRNDGIVDEGKLWPNATYPYTFDDNYNSEAIWVIKKAMEEISSKTCMKFVPRRREKDWVEFFSGRGCWSFAGNQKKGKQKLSLQDPGCIPFTGIVIHEIMHSLGYAHEHQREDRDDHLKINWDNIDRKNYEDFAKINTTHNTKYDYGSIMLRRGGDAKHA